MRHEPIPAPDALHDEGQRRAALLRRTLPALLIPAVAVLATALALRFLGGEPPPPPPSFPMPPPPPPDVMMRQPSPIPMLAVMVGLPLLLSAVLFRVIRAGRTTAPALALVGMWTLVYTLGALSSGVMSFWPASLVVPICAAAVLLGSRAGMAVAALATLLVLSGVWLEVQGLRLPLEFSLAGPVFIRWMPPPGPPPGFPFPRPGVPGLLLLAIGYWTGLYWTVAVLASLLAGGLQRALQQSRAQARALSDLSLELEDRVAAQTAELLVQEREAATMEERTRLARDIHDTLAQNLTGIIVQLGAVQRALAVAPDQVDEHLELAQRMARESLAEARRSVWNLRAPALERGDLGDALRGLVARPLSAATTARFEQTGAPWPLPPGVEAALLRVCQEALANVAKHARATRVTVTLAYDPAAVRLSVRDDGVGFDDATLRERPSQAGPWSGFGLVGMRERLAALGGTLALRNDGGAQLIATVPRTEAAGAAPPAAGSLDPAGDAAPLAPTATGVAGSGVPAGAAAPTAPAVSVAAPAEPAGPPPAPREPTRAAAARRP